SAECGSRNEPVIRLPIFIASAQVALNNLVLRKAAILDHSRFIFITFFLLSSGEEVHGETP
ncbi:MAG: hypothetical protein ACLQPD_02515, partial [Desulfomonilaceae bacterium]